MIQKTVHVSDDQNIYSKHCDHSSVSLSQQHIPCIVMSAKSTQTKTIAITIKFQNTATTLNWSAQRSTIKQRAIVIHIEGAGRRRRVRRPRKSARTAHSVMTALI